MFFLIRLTVLLLILNSNIVYSKKSRILTSRNVSFLIKSAQPKYSVSYTRAWGRDVIWALRKNEIPATKENVCSVLAVVDQESNFVADPAVAGLGKKAIALIDKKLSRNYGFGSFLKSYLSKYPSVENSYYIRFGKAKTERDLDLIYREIIQNTLGAVGISSYFKSIIEKHNEIDTIGSMQVSVAYAIKTEQKRRNKTLDLREIEKLRDYMYTRKGGLFFGSRVLLGYQTQYTRKIHRFADFNAGRYASRNAGFQFMLNKLTGGNLALDGDLLSYTNKRPSWQYSNTEKEIHKILSRFHFKEMTKDVVRNDLLSEKEWYFSKTGTYFYISFLYLDVVGKSRVKYKLPQIRLKSAKLTRKFTTALFARKVNHRYRLCIRRTKRI